MKLRRYRMNRAAIGASTVTLFLFFALALGASAMEITQTAAYVLTPAGETVRGVDVTPDGSTVYAGGIKGKCIIKLSVPSGEVSSVSVADFGGKASGKAVAVDSQGRVWAPVTVPFLAVFDKDLKLVQSFDLALFEIVTSEGVAVSPAGDIYVTNRNKDKPGMFKFRLVDGELKLVTTWGIEGWSPLAELRIPEFTPKGDLLISSWTAGQVHLVNASDGTSTLFAEVPRAFQLDVDGAGRVYIVHYEKTDPALTVLNADGSQLGSWSAGNLGLVSQASGVSVSQDGKTLYILDQKTEEGGMVRVYDISD